MRSWFLGAGVCAGPAPRSGESRGKDWKCIKPWRCVLWARLQGEPQNALILFNMVIQSVAVNQRKLDWLCSLEYMVYIRYIQGCSWMITA